MDEKYKPEQEIPNSFWEFIEKCTQDSEKLERVLGELSQEEIKRLYRIYFEAVVELSDLIALSDEFDGSEDDIEDISDAMVALGKENYLDMYYGRKKLPEFEEWEKYNDLLYVFINVYDKRYDCILSDEVELS